MKTYTITRKRSLGLYILLSIVPGLFCSASMRPAFFTSEGGTLLLGLAVTPLPFVTLAAYLLYLTKTPKLTSNEVDGRLSLLTFWGIFCVIMDVIALLWIISSTNALSDVMAGHRIAEEYELSSHTLGTWIGGWFAGWIVILFGFYSLLKRHHE